VNQDPAFGTGKTINVVVCGVIEVIVNKVVVEIIITTHRSPPIRR
jgi:hypothetical protein